MTKPPTDPPFPYDNPSDPIIVRHTQAEDFDGIIEMSLHVYGGAWRKEQLASHLDVFPQGQVIAVERGTGRVVGMAASLIVFWDDYDMNVNWSDITANGFFTNHDPQRGRTLYGAEVMVEPDMQGHGIGKKIYAARRHICRSLGLLRIRAGARLRGYSRYAQQMTADEYVRKIVNKELGDPTLSFQLKQEFRVLAVVKDYLRHDPESLGYAAVIEWLNHLVARRSDYQARDTTFMPDILKLRATLAGKHAARPVAVTPDSTRKEP
jgi:GNAT superfamily N-acetyltransferase